MALWAFIPGKEFIPPLGPLPAAAQRRDTGEWVYGADVEKWSAAVGYWNIESPTVQQDLAATNNLTDDEVEAIVEDVTAVISRRQAVEEWIEDLRQEAAGGKAQHWDFIDAYSPVPIPGSQATGESWPQFPIDPNPTTLAQAITWVNRKVAVLDDRDQILRTHAAWSSYHTIRLIDTVLLLVDIVDALTQVVDIEPPTPR